MTRCVGDRDGRLRRECFHGAGTLGQQLEQLESLGRRDGLADAGNLLIDAVLETAGASGHGTEYSIIYLNMQLMAGRVGVAIAEPASDTGRSRGSAIVTVP